MQVANAAIGYQETVLSEPIDLDVRRKDAIALVGPNGIGKSTLLKSLIHKIPLIRGDVHLGANVSIGYYDQTQSDLHSTKTILKELWDEHPTTPEVEIRTILGSFLFLVKMLKNQSHCSVAAKGTGRFSKTCDGS